MRHRSRLGDHKILKSRETPSGNCTSKGMRWKSISTVARRDQEKAALQGGNGGGRRADRFPSGRGL